LVRDLGLSSDEIVDSTNPGSVENADIKLTPDQAAAKLQANGFDPKTVGNGRQAYVKGDTQYTMYPKADSTGGPSMQVKDSTGVVGKVRFK
jgi:hypothetical protein